MSDASQGICGGQAGRGTSDDEEVECNRGFVRLIWGHRQRGYKRGFGESLATVGVNI